MLYLYVKQMAYQNINQYNYPKLKLQVIYDGQDMSLASDEVDYNQEVIFSPYLIGSEKFDCLFINGKGNCFGLVWF